MCGICGVYDKTGMIDKALIKSMTNTMHHRGPDDIGLFIDDNLGMGMRRLSIIDLNTGKQPISNEDGSITIVFNGEIYNYKELRIILQIQGHKFSTDSDTEVIVHAYEEYGSFCVNHLNGMFAFSIWDANKKILFIARDRLGIKPLYYYHDDKMFIFGSEIKAILETGIKRQINHKAMHHYIGYEYIPTPYSIIDNVYKLPQGSFLVFNSKEHTIGIIRYWDYHYKTEDVNEDYFKDRLLHELSESVKTRLISDVPLGAFLSGGIDSSMIVGLMSKHMKDEPVKTFSIGFEDESYNELKHANRVAELFSTDHHEKVITPDTVKITNEIVKYLDEPFSDVSLIPTYIVSKFANKKVKVVLSGDGSDELFAGYDRYVASKLASRYKVPGFIKRNLASHMKPQDKKKGFINKFQRFNEGLMLPDESRHMKWQYFSNTKLEKDMYTEGFFKETLEFEDFRPINIHYNYIMNKNRLDKEQYTDVNLYLPDDILVKLDRMSMANSLEARVPFLDHRMVEFSATIPVHLRLKGLTTKYILKKAARELLPRDIIHRKKEGFSIPIKNWLRDDLKSMMIETLDNPFYVRQGYIKQKSINRLIEKHISKRYNYSHQIFSLMMLELWGKKYLENV